MDMVCNCFSYWCDCRRQQQIAASLVVASFARFRFPTSDYKKNQVLVRSWRECKEGVKHNQRLDDDKDFECKLQ